MSSPTVTDMGKIRDGGRQGAVFGFMEGVVMLMGVLIGLATTGDKRIAVLGVLAAGVADAFANSAGFHVSQESEGIYTQKSITMSTIWCFFATVCSSIVIVIPLILLPLNYAIVVSFVIAITTLIFIALYVGKYHRVSGMKLIVEYVLIGVVAALATHYIGKLIVSLV